MEDFLELLAKREEKKGHNNMVTAESCEDQNPKEEANAWVLTQGGIRERIELERGEKMQKE
jgi:hypothetical protein